ncbi:YbaB/EbfC family nucleoid-associated protein [Speluncibacter jeojiensis]|uniref:YbaB/EbfC family nucleoid-associated protein n=1 Tax=Speluncibacter jeojiensis TaxID=2710754 RepID=A0A9X4RDF1_9ACTN|nr:YbaB/EbfC family nucleoid-associated protein [Corynebacteriales bacterium D3-21]
MTNPAEPDDLEAQVAEIRRLAQQAQETVARVRGQANAANGAVAATVDARGRVDDLRLSPQALRMTADDLASAIADCIRGAQDQAAESARTATQAFADRSEIRGALAAMDEFAAEPAATAVPDRQEDDDYFDEFTRDPLGRSREG